MQTKTAYSESTTYISRARSLPVGASVDTTFTRTGLWPNATSMTSPSFDGIASVFNGLAVHCDAPGVRHPLVTVRRLMRRLTFINLSMRMAALLFCCQEKMQPEWLVPPAAWKKWPISLISPRHPSELAGLESGSGGSGIVISSFVPGLRALLRAGARGSRLCRSRQEQPCRRSSRLSVMPSRTAATAFSASFLVNSASAALFAIRSTFGHCNKPPK